MAGKRRLCSSPLSSADEAEDAGASSTAFPELIPSPPSKPLRKKKSAAKKSLRQPKKLKHKEKGTKELVHDAPQELLEYLSEQLSAVQQIKYESEFGKGHGFVVKLPSANWKSKRKRDELKNWLKALGFSSASSLGRNALEVTNLKADVILGELKQRVPAIAEDNEEEDLMIKSANADDSAHDADEKEKGGESSTDPVILRMKKYYEKLETQKLEVVSFSENHQWLSSVQHMAIADAIENALAQPSVRRDRRLARRLSKLGRVSGRRLSSIAATPSSFLPPVEDDWIWDRKMDKLSLTPVKRRISHAERSSTQKKSMLGESVLHLVLHSGLVDTKTMKEVLRKVSIMWKNMAVMTCAWTSADYSTRSNVYSMDQIYTSHPRGHYLADGAYKKVFKVFSSEQKRLEAISVMDIGAIEDTGNQGVVRQEVAHSILLSHATEDGVCPNFLRIFEVFLAHEQPQPDRWGSKTRRRPVELLSDMCTNSGDLSRVQDPLLSSASDENERLFQYIRMEFCDGGDLEDFIGLQKNKAIPHESVAVPFFFQMVFGLYCAREKFNLRHYDLKLLNFFLKDISRGKLRKASEADVVLHYLLEDSCFVLRLPASFSYWVKLADYGSADSNTDNLGIPVTIDQFATLENSPVEFLLEGDAAEQSYAADTFPLGLCLLHLFTGSAPYEEILEEVHCPAELLTDLRLLWLNTRKNSKFSVIKSVAHGHDENTLCHTLYRYLVLFGLPDQNPSEAKRIDQVWQLLLKHLRPEDPANKHSKRRSRRANNAQQHLKTPKDQYVHDQALYSLSNGSNAIIRRCRDGLETTRGAMDLLKKMVDFNPLKRPTLKQVMYHPVFSSLRLPDKKKDTQPDCVVSYYQSRLEGARLVPDL